MTQPASNPLLSVAAFLARILPVPIKRLIYRVRPLARLVRGGLNRAAPEGLTVTSIAAGPLAGMRMQLDLQVEKDYWLGTYEPELVDAVSRMVRSGSTIFDVGANIGYVSMLLAKAAGTEGRVYSFEALPGNLDRLCQNIALNGLEKQITVVPSAVIDRVQKVRFLVGPSGGMGKAEGSAGRQEVSYSQSIEVDGISLDHFVYEQGNPAPAVVKMDIEGGEVLALPGMCRLLAEAQPLILLELHGPEAAGAAWDELTKAGYTISRMESGFPEIPSVNQVGWKSYIVAKRSR